MSRLKSLDVFRGLTVALMIFVNSIDYHYASDCFKHASWDGCTFADLVFPFFIFILGTSTYLWINQAKDKLSQRDLIFKIIKRSLFLFSMGLFLNAFPHFDLANLRIFGILQRIAICYGLTALICLTMPLRKTIFFTVYLLIGYWLLLIQHPLTESSNFAFMVDKLFIPKAHLYHGQFDPEGLFSTISALITALLGVLLGYWLTTSQTSSKKVCGIIIVGFVLCLLGFFWSMVFPFNKALWTSSYVLWTGGIACFTFAFCFWAIEIKGWHLAFKPFLIFGNAALMVFVLHVLLLKIQALITIESADQNLIKLRDWLTTPLWNYCSKSFAACIYSLGFILLCFLLINFYNYLKELQRVFVVKAAINSK